MLVGRDLPVQPRLQLLVLLRLCKNRQKPEVPQNNAHAGHRQECISITAKFLTCKLETFLCRHLTKCTLETTSKCFKSHRIGANIWRSGCQTKFCKRMERKEQRTHLHNSSETHLVNATSGFFGLSESSNMKFIPTPTQHNSITIERCHENWFEDGKGFYGIRTAHANHKSSFS